MTRERDRLIKRHSVMPWSDERNVENFVVTCPSCGSDRLTLDGNNSAEGTVAAAMVCHGCGRFIHLAIQQREHRNDVPSVWLITD